MADMSRVVGVVGWRNSGKTRLVTALVAEFARRGLDVATVKHAHHRFDIDKPGKDSYEHRQAGARQVLVASDNRWALMTELDQATRPPLADLVTKLADADIIIAEGFKGEPHPKIEVRRDPDVDPLSEQDPSIFAVATELPDTPVARTAAKVSPDNISGIADMVAARLGLRG